MPEILKYIGPSIITALLTYWFTNKSKRSDIHNQKIKELNTILSNMLIVWDYLNKLNLTLKFWEDESDELVFPKEFLPIFLFNSGTSNEKCFEDLEKSIENLKQYDSLTYYKLEGIGKRIDVIRKGCIMPVIKAKAKTEQTIGMSRNFLDKLRADIEDSLENVAILISRKSIKEIRARIEDKRTIDIGEIIEEVNQEYYCYIVSILPREIGTISYEDFKEGFRKPEMRQILADQIDLFAENDIEKIIEKFTQNPNINIEDLKASMKI